MENQPIQSPAQEPSPPPPPKNNSGLFIGILIFLLGILIGLVMGKTTLLSGLRIPFLTATPTPLDSPKPTAGAVDPTTTWKTYTGKVFQYKYPNNLYLVDLNHNDSIDLFANKESADTSVTCFKNKLGTPQNPCPGSLMQVMITSANAQEAPQTASPSGSIKFSSSTNPQGIQMLKNEEAIGGMGRSIVFTAFVVKDPMIYTIAVQTTPQGYWQTLYPSDTKTDSEILNSESILLNQILSTFKFVDQTPTPTCRPRPACLDATPRCLIPETSDMCPPTITPTQKACTLEQKICPDGSYPKRKPNCEWEPCP